MENQITMLNDYNRRKGYKKVDLANLIGISTATLAKVFRGEPVSAATQTKVDAWLAIPHRHNYLRQDGKAKPDYNVKPGRGLPKPKGPRPVSPRLQPLLIHRSQEAAVGVAYVDESMLEGQLRISLVTQASAHDFAMLRQQLYPHGWRPGNEIKARTRAVSDLAPIIRTISQDSASRFIFTFPGDRLDQMPKRAGLLFPYFTAILALIAATPAQSQFTLFLDGPANIDPALVQQLEAHLVAYVQTALGRTVTLSCTWVDSKASLGVQAADFVAYAASQLRPLRLWQLGVRVADFDLLGMLPLFADYQTAFRQLMADRR